MSGRIPRTIYYIYACVLPVRSGGAGERPAAAQKAASAGAFRRSRRGANSRHIALCIKYSLFCCNMHFAKYVILPIRFRLNMDFPVF